LIPQAGKTVTRFEGAVEVEVGGVGAAEATDKSAARKIIEICIVGD